MNSAYEVNIPELYTFKICDVVSRVTCACLHLESLKSPPNDFSCEASCIWTPGFQRIPFPQPGCVIRAVLSTVQFRITESHKFSINRAWETQQSSPPQSFGTFSPCSAALLPKSQLSSAFPVTQVPSLWRELWKTHSVILQHRVSSLLMEHMNLILAAGKLYLVSFWFGCNLPLLQLMNMRLFLGCFPPISGGERCLGSIVSHWCRRGESYILQFSFHYSLEGCDLFPLSLLETEVFISAFHWGKHLTVNISELFQCFMFKLGEIRAFWVSHPCLTSLWQ